MRFTRSPRDENTGLLRYVSCIYGGLRLDGITLRRTRTGELTLCFPERRRGHPYFCPVDADARRVLEDAILEALKRGEESP